MTVPDDVFSCCCDWGTELANVNGGDVWFLNMAGSANNWTSPHGTTFTNVSIVRRRARDFKATGWPGAGLPSGASQLGNLTVDPDGNVYRGTVTQVIKYDSEHNVIWSYTDPNVGAIGTTQPFSRPCVNANRNVWSLSTTDSTNRNLQLIRLDAEGNLLWAVVDTDLHASSIIGYGLGVTLDEYAYISLYDNGASQSRLSRIDPDGAEDWTITVDTGSTGRIRDIAVDSSGNVVIVLPKSHSIRCYDTSGSLLWSRDFASGVTQPSLSNLHHAICVDNADDIIVSGSTNTSPIAWAIKKISGSTQADVWTASLTSYLFPLELATDSFGRVYAACDRTDAFANNFASQRQHNASGTLIGSDFFRAYSRSVAATPGKWPHFG